MNFLRYLKESRYIKTEEIGWKYILFLVFIYFILVMPLGSIIGLLSEMLNITHEFKNNRIQLSFLQVVFFAPLMEESLFRLLLKPKIKNLLAFSVISSLVIFYLFWKTHYQIATIWICLQIVSLLLIWKRQSYFRQFYRIYIRRFPYFFYFSIIMFGLVHLGNFTYPEITIWIVLLSPLLILPQLIMGSMLGFIRMKWGIVYSILFHTMVNGIAFSIMNLN